MCRLYRRRRERIWQRVKASRGLRVWSQKSRVKSSGKSASLEPWSPDSRLQTRSVFCAPDLRPRSTLVRSARGVDTGGTFTDFVFTAGGQLQVFKLPST